MDVTQTPLSSFIGGESQHCISNEFNWIFQHCKSDNKEQIWRDVECPDWPGTRSCWFLHGTCLQIQTSRFITVQYYYLYMAVTVCYDGLFRPNFAQLMDAKCEEERGHAKMVADFQVGRMGDVKLIPHAAIGKATTCHIDSVTCIVVTCYVARIRCFGHFEHSRRLGTDHRGRDKFDSRTSGNCQIRRKRRRTWRCRPQRWRHPDRPRQRHRSPHRRLHPIRIPPGTTKGTVSWAVLGNLKISLKIFRSSTLNFTLVDPENSTASTIMIDYKHWSWLMSNM